MESKAKRSACPLDNSLPNTIVIQLVSPQPQAMSNSVHPMPRFPGTKASVEQQRRPGPAAPNNTKGPRVPSSPRMLSPNRPEMYASPRRRTSPDQLAGNTPFRSGITPGHEGSCTNNTRRSHPDQSAGCFTPGNKCSCTNNTRRTPPDQSAGYSTPGHKCSCTNNTNQPPGPGRAVVYRMAYVLQPDEEMTPTCSRSPRPVCNCFGRDGPARQKEAESHCCCCNCCRGQISIPKLEDQVTPPGNNSPPSRQNSAYTASCRDQATNTPEQPQDLQSLKTICEALGRALVAAAAAVVEAGAHKSQQAADCSTDQAQKEKGPMEEYASDQTVRLKGNSKSSMQLHAERHISIVTTFIDDHLNSKYPKTPKTSSICLATTEAGEANPSIHRRFPTEDQSPQNEIPCTASPDADIPLVLQPDNLKPSSVTSDQSTAESPKDPSAVTSPTDSPS